MDQHDSENHGCRICGSGSRYFSLSTSTCIRSSIRSGFPLLIRLRWERGKLGRFWKLRKNLRRRRIMECCSELNRLRDYRRPVNDNASPDPRCFCQRACPRYWHFSYSLLPVGHLISGGHRIGVKCDPQGQRSGQQLPRWLRLDQLPGAVPHWALVVDHLVVPHNPVVWSSLLHADVSDSAGEYRQAPLRGRSHRWCRRCEVLLYGHRPRHEDYDGPCLNPLDDRLPPSSSSS